MIVIGCTRAFQALFLNSHVASSRFFEGSQDIKTVSRATEKLQCANLKRQHLWTLIGHDASASDIFDSLPLHLRSVSHHDGVEGIHSGPSEDSDLETDF